jgi:hypothetical protein
MTFQQSEYEHLQNSNNELSESCMSQPISNGHGYLRPQAHDRCAHNQSPVFPFLGVVPRDHESSQALQHSERKTVFHQRLSSSSSQVNHGSDALRPKPDTLITSSKKSKVGFWNDTLSDWWWWELGSVLLSCACFAAVVIMLWMVQERSLSSWRSVISPNTLVSILATVSKSSLMLAVAACLSQLKWLYFESAPHQIQNIQIFDDASRGPLGALELLTTLSSSEVVSRRSSAARWTFWASVLTVLALASDPFAQQLLSFPSRTVPNLTDPLAALISTSQVYDTRMTGYARNIQDMNVDMAMQGAVQNGLYTLNSPVKFSCTTANCT